MTQMLQTGQILTRPAPPLTQAAFSDFGALLGTDAPIHTDPAYAAATPFGGTIAQGMLLLAPFEPWLCELFGEAAWSQGGTLRARLLRPARAGNTVTLELQVTESRAGFTAFALRVICQGHDLARGEATVTLP